MSVPWVFPGGPLVLGACEARVPGGRTGPPWEPSLATKALHNLRPRCWSARGCLPSALRWGWGGGCLSSSRAQGWVTRRVGHSLAHQHRTIHLVGGGDRESGLTYFPQRQDPGPA